MPKPYIPYYDLKRLVEIYHFISSYREKNQLSPAMSDIVGAGLASSNGMVSYYYDHMRNLGMVEFVVRNGRRVGVKLLPLANAHPSIVLFLKESQ